MEFNKLYQEYGTVLLVIIEAPIVPRKPQQTKQATCWKNVRKSTHSSRQDSQKVSATKGAPKGQG